MNKNKIKYNYINILKKYNYNFKKDIKNYKLNEIIIILDEHLYKISCKNKIIKFFKYISSKKLNNLNNKINNLECENRKLINERNSLLYELDIINNK